MINETAEKPDAAGRRVSKEEAMQQDGSDKPVKPDKNQLVAMMGKCLQQQETLLQ